MFIFIRCQPSLTAAAPTKWECNSNILEYLIGSHEMCCFKETLPQQSVLYPHNLACWICVPLMCKLWRSIRQQIMWNKWEAFIRNLEVWYSRLFLSQWFCCKYLPQIWIHAYNNIYICMNVCLYICMYICIYISVNEHMYVHTYICKYLYNYILRINS